MNPRTVLLCLGVAAAGCLAGCASAPKPDPMVFTDQALAATEPAKVAFPLESTNAADPLARFKQFNGDFSAENITNRTKAIYAADVWFRDDFKEIHGEPGFEAYLLRGSAATALYAMEWRDVAESHGDYYFRWVMTVKLKRDGKHKPPTRTPGISQVRFRADGKVIFQQDYFDAGAFLYERIPVLGSEIRFIKKRM